MRISISDALSACAERAESMMPASTANRSARGSTDASSRAMVPIHVGSIDGRLFPGCVTRARICWRR